MLRTIITVILLLFAGYTAMSQHRNAIWCFGDSAGIDFTNVSMPVPITSGLDTKGGSCVIADSSGNLLFYTSTSNPDLWWQGYTKLGVVWNKNHEVMENGDTLLGRAWYNEVMIIPFPDNDSLFYAFFIGVTTNYGLDYQIINMNADSGLGSVISKNNHLQTFAMVDCLNAIKHGNGRDWWLIFRRYNQATLSPNNKFHTYLITPAGITNFTVQHVGSMSTTNGGKLTFSKDGSKLIYTNLRGLIEKYDFDRCTGVISNPVNIQVEYLTNFDTLWAANELSPNGQVLYVSTSNDTSYLFQYDLNASNINASRQTIWTQTNPINAGGYFKRGPDDKIYFSCVWNDGSNFPYPYPDSAYYTENMNLGVINTPDSLGAACSFLPYSFNLGGKRCYWGLTNNPDYDLGPVADTCDTATGISEVVIRNTAVLFVSYIPSWQKAFINAQHLKGSTYTLTVTDITNRQVFNETGRLRPPYFTFDLDCEGFAKGLYMVILQTEREQLVKKFVKD